MRKPIIERLRQPIILGEANWERILAERAEAALVIEQTSAMALKYMRLCKALQAHLPQPEGEPVAKAN